MKLYRSQKCILYISWYINCLRRLFFVIVHDVNKIYNFLWNFEIVYYYIKLDKTNGDFKQFYQIIIWFMTFMTPYVTINKMTLKSVLSSCIFSIKPLRFCTDPKSFCPVKPDFFLWSNLFVVSSGRSLYSIHHLLTREWHNCFFLALNVLVRLVRLHLADAVGPMYCSSRQQWR